MPRQPPLKHFTILLLKPEISSHSEALKEGQDLVELGVASVGGTLFAKPRQVKKPWWIDYVRSYVTDQEALDGLLNASTSAVLFFKAADRTFAVTFGHGRNLLEPTSFERDFGLKVVLNTVAPDQLKSIDARTYEELTVHTRRDVSRGSSIEAFGLDISRDLVRSVTGQPRDETLARRVTGSDSLALRSRAQLPELPDLCRRLLDAYGADTYKDRFGWIDHLRPVKDPAETARLNDALVIAIRRRALDDMHLAPPEPMDWERIEGFRFSTEEATSEPHTDPPISAYLDSIDDPEAIDLQRLKGDKVMAVGSDQGELFTQWPVYRCLVFETRHEGRLFALSAGDWYSIDLSFAEEVERFAADLPELDVALPEAKKGATEAVYNAAAATAVDALNMDRQLIKLSNRDPVELCDLLTRSKQFIHVKRRGGSSTLSHLFLQGLVSAELLFRDQLFRDAARAQVDDLDSSFTPSLPDSRPEPGECEVAFVVLTRSSRDTPLTLPFFSLVSLKNAVEQLSDRGFKVSARAVAERA
jgi:uncharacterized protein (TIGR04141 family)